jgi:hypothetical protein
MPGKKPAKSIPEDQSVPDGLKVKKQGAPAGANQGGAPRGGSRLDPSHAHLAQKQDQAGHEKGGKKRVIDRP